LQAEAAPAEAASEPAPAAEAPTPVQTYAEIDGAWDVASFEGYEPRRLSGTSRAAFADFRPAGVGLRIECNYSGRSGTVRDGRFVRVASDGGQTAMSCGPERHDRERRFFSFFENNPTIERLGPERLRLKSGATELILERPALRRLKFVPAPADLEGKWRLLELTRYHPEGGYSGIGLSEVPGRLVFSGDRLFYSRCPQYGLSFRWGEGGRLEKEGAAAPPAAPADCRELREPYPVPALPKPADLLELLHGNPAVERSGDALLISTDRLGLLITKAPCESVEQSKDHRTSRVLDCASPE
jgi:heat shock protein HslJ